MKEEKFTPAQRWFALMLVTVNIAFNFCSSWFSPGGRTIKQVSDEYVNLFMPAPYAFAIWGLIYGSIFIYAVVQALPGVKNLRAYHELSFPVSFISILSMCWLLSFLNELLLVSEVIIAVMLITSLYALVKARNYASAGELGRWAVIPFSLYAGWLSVATIANTSAWLTSTGYDGGSIGAEKWAEIMLLIAVALGSVVSFRFKDIVYPAVIAWGVIGIWASWNTTSNVSATALAGGIVLVIVSIINALRKERVLSHSRPRPALHKP